MTPRILFLDQSGQLGGAELCLIDFAQSRPDRSRVALLSDGPFRHLLEQQQIPVTVLSDRPIAVRKDSSWRQGWGSWRSLINPIRQIVQLAQNYDLIYANTPKALVVGAIASALARRSLVYHLHDIISPEHFSAMNRRILVTLTHRSAWVIANSEASRQALIAAGGPTDRISVVYNGFQPAQYQPSPAARQQIRDEWGWGDRFVLGQFSRLSPWKGQHVLLEALTQCPPEVVALLVGEALFGEQDYAAGLHQQVEQLGLQSRVRFLGFRSDIPALMSACDAIGHTSTAPEPFGRVIVEGMLSAKPVIAAAAGGAIELIQPGETGWLVPPGDPIALAAQINACRADLSHTQQIAEQARQTAAQRFDLAAVNRQLEEILAALPKV